MPLPEPIKGEKQPEFIKRCMSDPVTKKEFPAADKRLAVCYSQWGKKKVDFKGFDDWIAIFQGGKQVDSQGREHDGDTLIDLALSKFNPEYHEPPACIGHPADNKPAYGWVTALKEAPINGSRGLWAKFKDVNEAFAGMLQRGELKKRSAAFHPDYGLRHVAFLGSATPAVKGLPDMAFKADDALINIIFMEMEEEENGMVEIKDVLELLKAGSGQGKEGQETPVSPAPVPIADPVRTFSEGDVKIAIQAAVKNAVKAENDRLNAEFAEKETQRKAAAKRGMISVWLDQQRAAGHIAPAWEKAGLAQFMSNLDNVEVMAFSEGGEPVDRLKWFQDFITGLPKLVDFNEIATRDKDIDPGTNTAEKIEALISEKMKGSEMAYGEAIRAVFDENPELAKNFTAAMEGGK